MLVLAPDSNYTLYRMNVSSWAYLAHWHTNACVTSRFCSVYFHFRGETEQALFCWWTTKAKGWGLVPIWDQKMMLVECSCGFMFLWSSVFDNCTVYLAPWLWSGAGNVWYPWSQGSGKGSSQWDSEKNTGIEYLQGKKSNHFLSCAQTSTFHSLNAFREAETKSSLNIGHVASDQKAIYSHNFSAAVAVVEI